MTKKIAVVAANGKAGKLIVKEADQRDMDVTAFVRSENATVAQKAAVKDIMDLTAEDLAEFDAVVDALMPSAPGPPRPSPSTPLPLSTCATCSLVAKPAC